MHSRRFAVLLLGYLLVVNIVHAEIKPETAIKYRQSVYHVILWNFLPLADMAKGKLPFDQREAGRRAERIAALSLQLLEGYPLGSNSGAQTDAKAEIWENFTDFEAKMNTLIEESRALSEIAKGGDKAKFTAQFQKTAGACKACHEKYRAD